MTSHTEQELDAFVAWERSAWEVRAAPYAASLGDLTRGSVPALLDAAGVGAGSRVLDVGTGPGFVALAAAARDADVVAVDQSPAMVDIARAAGVDAVTAPVEDLPLADGSRDAVVAGYLLNHLPRPEAAVASLARVLRTGGRLAMTVWDLPDANPALGLFGPVVTELGLTGVVPPGPDSARFADDGQARRLLAGWLDVEVRRVGWTVAVEPGAWFDAVADATPRTGAVLSQAAPEQRSRARARYVELALSSYGAAGGRVELPASAVLLSAERP
jgi:SAM-dependent methyltransferase